MTISDLLDEAEAAVVGARAHLEYVLGTLRDEVAAPENVVEAANAAVGKAEDLERELQAWRALS